MSFWSELRRRNVVKVGIAYAIVAWLLIQGADIIFPHLNLPSWAVTFLIVFLIIGFPLALLFAWAFEITPDGIKLTKEVPRAESITHLTGKKLNYILAGVIVLGVAYIVFDKFYIARRAIKTEKGPVVSDVEEVQKTIAVLPFDDLSPEKDQEYFVLGLSEEILNSLAQIADLTVVAKTSSFSFKGKNKTIQEIASVLEVENILEGSVRKAGNALRITAQLVKAVDGSHLWSKTYDRELKDIFTVQEDIASAVADELKATLGIVKSLKKLGGTDSMGAYERYLIALGQMPTGDLAIINRAQELIDEAIAIDPKFALAWSLKSLIHYYLSIFSPAINAAAEQEASLSAALRAIELQPAVPDGYASLGLIKQTMGEFIEAALAFDKASELNIGVFWEMGYISLLKDAAYFKKARALLEEARQIDPLNRLVRASYIENLCCLGDIQQAEKENQRCIAVFGHDWGGNHFLTNCRLGSGQAVSRDQIVIDGFMPSTIPDAAKEYLESPKEGLLVLRRFYNEAENLSAADLTGIAFWAAYFREPKLTMDSIEKAISIDTGNINNYWYPLFKEVRQLSRFKKLVRDIGLVDYWNKFGWPDLCRPVGDGDFECN